MKNIIIPVILAIPLLVISCIAPVTTTLTLVIVTTLTPPTETMAIIHSVTIQYIGVDQLYSMVRVSYDPSTMGTDPKAPYATVDARMALSGWNVAHIPAAINIEPNIYHTDLEEQEMEWNLQFLPKDKLLVFYDDNLDLAPALATKFLDLNQENNWGYDPAKVRILADGFGVWLAKEYPVLAAAQIGGPAI